MINKKRIDKGACVALVSLYLQPIAIRGGIAILVVVVTVFYSF